VVYTHLRTMGGYPGGIYTTLRTMGGIPGWYIHLSGPWEAYQGGIYLSPKDHGRHTRVLYLFPKTMGGIPGCYTSLLRLSGASL